MAIFNVKYKDTLFRMVFSDKENLLSLYNALNGTNYADTSLVTINTLEDAVYIGYKNDVSLLIKSEMNIYEHQSTINKNMPYRGLVYMTNLLKSYVDVNGIDMYSSKLQKLPLPRYVIFYNGTEDMPEWSTLKLSDSFMSSVKTENTMMDELKKGSIEVKALVLNINYGHNKEIMKSCRMLEEYSCFVQLLRDKKQQLLEENDNKEIREDEKIVVEYAINLAIKEAISNNILSEILKKNRAEVTNMFLTKFDEEKYIKDRMNESFEDGENRGREEGIRTVKSTVIMNMLKKNYTIQQIAEIVDMSVDAVKSVIESQNMMKV